MAYQVGFAMLSLSLPGKPSLRSFLRGLSWRRCSTHVMTPLHKTCHILLHCERANQLTADPQVQPMSCRSSAEAGGDPASASLPPLPGGTAGATSLQPGLAPDPPTSLASTSPDEEQPRPSVADTEEGDSGRKSGARRKVLEVAEGLEEELFVAEAHRHDAEVHPTLFSAHSCMSRWSQCILKGPRAAQNPESVRYKAGASVFWA